MRHFFREQEGRNSVITDRSQCKTIGVSCRDDDGLPRMSDRVWGYYISRDGARMLVVECVANQRIWINDSIEIVVMGSNDDEVQFGIELGRQATRRSESDTHCQSKSANLPVIRLSVADGTPLRPADEPSD